MVSNAGTDGDGNQVFGMVWQWDDNSGKHFKLTRRLVQRPNIIGNLGDYTLETLNQEERRVVEATGGKFVFIPFVAGKSTTGLLEKITKL